MRGQPDYFEAIRKKAASRWDQLERDPELAGPWHQLFKQVQSPRHVLSELLQNADDAGATEALVRIEGQQFIFEHDGEDFASEHFASLCGFGYSNKRALHTIGFRGIGFKSTFSLGDRVELFTPSLAVHFHRKRFTEPHWVSEHSSTLGQTRIRVEIIDQQRKKELEKNLEEWLKSPVSLLFFKNIRRMKIGDREVHWGSLGPGPIPGSEWMSLYGQEDDSFLLVRAEEEAFPDEALAEIRQERMLGVDDGADFPPCRVEIVLGAKGRLYVVLPTGVETALPFACNAPFIQDPARIKVKDPEISPTNRWLLDRAGKLAATAMLHWLGLPDGSPIERAHAYGLFPNVDREDSSLEGSCGTIVEEAFDEVIDGVPFLLTEDGQLVCEKQCTAIAKPILDIWTSKNAVALLDDQARPALCRHVDPVDVEKLSRWGVIEEIDKAKLLEILQTKHLPRPETWRQLMSLWAYIAPNLAGYHYFYNQQDVRIVPVQGKDVLYAASEVIRLGEKKLLQSEDDWEFLAAHLIALNQNWSRFLAEERRTALEKGDSATQESVERAYAVLKKIGLDDTSDVNKVIDQVANEFFSEKSVALQGCARLAQIAAKLNANAGDAFRYVTKDKRLKAIDKTVLLDEDGKLEDLLPKEQRETQLLHAIYSASFDSCTSEDWSKWVSSGRAKLLTFIPLVQRRVDIYGKHSIQQEARKRGCLGELSYPYVTKHFAVEDWDFEESCWSHWKSLASQDEFLWTKVVERILAQRETYWAPARSARLLQVATTGRSQSMTNQPMLPSWLLRLQQLPCLPDTRGFRHKPDELLRRTYETESFIDVEPFVHGLLDRETTRPLLDLLGVRSVPTGPDGILDRLRALAKAKMPPVHEVEKWYRRLDQMIETCSTADFQEIRQAFRSEALVFTQDDAWASTLAVFLLSNEEDVPDAAIIRSSVRDLTLWRKIGVAERPTADLAIEWLMALESGAALTPDDLRRTRALLVRYPIRIWDECSHWLNLAGEWTPVDQLSYTLTMQSLIPWAHLHQWVKQRTADLQRLPAEVTSNLPFYELPTLAQRVEERLHRDLFATSNSEKKEWLTVLGAELRRIELEREEETKRIRDLAEVLVQTEWHTRRELEIIPYIDGTPAGTPRKADVLWLDRGLYVDRLPRAKLARRVPEEIGRAFGRADIKAALDYSFERSAVDVREYLEENFKLSPHIGLAGNEVTPIEKKLAETSEVFPKTDAELPDRTAADGLDESIIADLEQERAAPDGSEQGEPATVNELDTPDLRVRPAPKPVKISLVERFAKAQGFQKDGNERFFHEDGSWIGRVAGSPFSWERRSRSGELLRFYLPVTRCLEREPLEIEADVWSLLVQRPDLYALITTTIDELPSELTGAALTAMRDAGKVTVYPATYRLVHDANS
jgi:hypothetical protein